MRIRLAADHDARTRADLARKVAAEAIRSRLFRLGGLAQALALADRGRRVDALVRRVFGPALVRRVVVAELERRVLAAERARRVLLRSVPLVAVLPRRRAALLACRESAALDADLRGSRFSARLVARLRFAEGRRLRPAWAAWVSRFAERRVASLVCPAFGGGSGTPARRALESPIAIA